MRASRMVAGKSTVLLAAQAVVDTAAEVRFEREAVKSFDVETLPHRSNAAELNPGNASRAFLKIEHE